jgi:fumarate reductase iron-sulfur subunit
MHRELTINIFRYDPNDPADTPRMESYQVKETDGYSIYFAVKEIRETQDPTLKYDFSCTASVCGSCAMLINGKPRLACKTLTKHLPKKITLHPLPVFKLVGDLSVDTGTWFRTMGEKAGSWIHTKKEFDPDAVEERMDNNKALEIYELDRCIECGCCIAGCGTVNIRDEFFGAAGLLRIARFMIDPRDEREMQNYFDVIGTDEGVFGCMGLMACEDNCPKELPLQQQLAFVRRRSAQMGVTGKVTLQRDKLRIKKM